jgi:bacteriorhodopsin
MANGSQQTQVPRNGSAKRNGSMAANAGMAQPEKKSRKWLWWTIGIVAVIVIGIIIWVLTTSGN